MESAVESFEGILLRHDLLPTGQPVLAAVSGGADSMVLLDLLARLAPKYQWTLIVAHLNHQLRQEESDQDEAGVRQAADQYGLRCIARRENVLEYKRKAKCSLEQAARHVRHSFLAQTALDIGKENVFGGSCSMPRIALAHHADDQVELFFIRLLRGAGSSGLAGMDWISPSPVDPNLSLVRPLLGFRKEWILNYAQKRRINFRDDSSNFQTDILRNRLRHELIPNLLSEYQPGLYNGIAKTMEILRAESELTTKLANQWLEERSGQSDEVPGARVTHGSRSMASSSFKDLHRSIQRRVLQQQLFQLGILPEYDLIENLRAQPGQTHMIAPERAIFLSDQGIIGECRPPSKAPQYAPVILDLNQSVGETRFGNLIIRWEIQSGQKWPVSCFTPENKIEYFDLDKIGRKVIIRQWAPGDRFQPIGMKAAVKLQDLFTNSKVPESERHSRGLGENEEGILFWVEGLRIGQRCKVSEGTRTLLKWSWERIHQENNDQQPIL